MCADVRACVYRCECDVSVLECARAFESIHNEKCVYVNVCVRVCVCAQHTHTVHI